MITNRTQVKDIEFKKNTAKTMTADDIQRLIWRYDYTIRNSTDLNEVALLQRQRAELKELLRAKKNLPRPKMGGEIKK